MVEEIGKFSIDTPEQVELDFHVAGIGSRAMAVLIDHLLQGIIMIAMIVAGSLGFPLLHLSDNWRAAAFVIILFCAYWGYFTFFEMYWKGQTPGKKLLKIRVVKNNGRSITFYESMGRNLLRLVDSLPTFYAVGVITMFIDRLNRRLGDLVAGTIVVHERAQQESDGTFDNFSAVEPSEAAYDVSGLGSEELVMIERFLARRLDIDYSARLAIREKLATLVRSKLNLQELPEGVGDEDFLEHVARLMRSTASFRR
jgi:uncharacterized RDD family membrane protein YckC